MGDQIFKYIRNTLCNHDRLVKYYINSLDNAQKWLSNGRFDSNHYDSIHSWDTFFYKRFSDIEHWTFNSN